MDKSVGDGENMTRPGSRGWSLETGHRLVESITETEAGASTALQAAANQEARRQAAS